MKFVDVNEGHLQPIIDALKAGNRERAAQLFGELVDSIPGIKSFEVFMLKNKVLSESGLLSSRRKRT